LVLGVASAIEPATAQQRYDDSYRPGSYRPAPVIVAPVPQPAYRNGGPRWENPRREIVRYTRPSIWMGLYGGIHAGGGFSTVDQAYPATGKVDIDGFVGGAHVGYNFQSGGLVAGYELDVSGTAMKATEAFTSGLSTSASRAWMSSARLRLGYSFDNVLLYATGGVAFSDLDLKVTDGLSTVGSRDVYVGYVVGGGVEVKMSRNISARVEALHYDFGSKTVDLGTVSSRINSDVTTVRAGLTFHFD
jgi:outer membrane immunogenic protein